MYEASFELRHECPYREFSEQFPDVTVREWHHNDCQLLEVTSATAAEGELRAEIDEIGEIMHATSGADGMYVVARSCKCPIDGSVLETFQDYNCIHLPPTVYTQGWEQYSVLGFAEGDIRALLQALDGAREIDVISKTAIEEQQLPYSSLVSVDRLFGDLTDRQLSALRIALDNDYYGQPRGASIAELAEYTDIARATFEEHLRKAENKLMRNAGQFVRLLTENQKPTSLRSDARREPRPARGD